MDSIIKSFWFWLLIIGVALILTAILIAGGMKEMKGWTWGIFILGCVLAILGIIFAFVAWGRAKDYVESKETCSAQIEDCGCDAKTPFSNYTSQHSTPQITKVSTNIPQAQRGFSATSVDLSALAPESR